MAPPDPVLTGAFPLLVDERSRLGIVNHDKPRIERNVFHVAAIVIAKNFKTAPDEVVIERCVTQPLQPRSESAQSLSVPGQRLGHLDGLAKIKWLECSLVRGGRVFLAKGTDDPPQIGAQLRDRKIIAHVDRRQPLRQSRLIEPGQHPLREIVGESFRQEMMLVESLKGVIKNGSIARLAQRVAEFGGGVRPVVFHPREIRGCHELERLFAATPKIRERLSRRVRRIDIL